MLRFDRFMEEALYHPERGYYERLSSLGRTGDFYTAPSLHPLFGWTLARFVTPVLKGMERPVVVEAGAGLGDLAGAALDFWRRFHPDLYGRLEYRILERSRHLRARQRDRLADHPRVRFVETLEPFTGVFWANEVLDAFPVRVFRREEGFWKEVFVALSPEPQEVLREVDDPPAVLSRVPEGVVQVEVAEGMAAFLEAVGRALERGMGVLIDYGEEEETLFSRYPSGTLQGYRNHRVVDPLEHPGETDITAFVNFTAVRRVLAATGCRVEALRTQERFLFQAGIHEALELYERAFPGEAMRARLSLKTLLLAFPTYRVLVFHKP